MFVSATPPSVSALTLLPKKMSIPEKSGVLFEVGLRHVRRPNYAPTLVVRRPQRGHINFPGIGIFFGQSVSALTLGGVALTNTNENLHGRIFLEG